MVALMAHQNSHDKGGPKPPASCAIGAGKTHAYPNLNTTTDKWLIQQPSPVPRIPQFHCKNTLAAMCHQPHPSPSFMAVLLCMGKNNHQSP